MIELNESKIDRFRNSVKCGLCKTWWGLERWNTDIYTCKKCLTDMVRTSVDPMPIRDSLRGLD